MPATKDEVDKFLSRISNTMELARKGAYPLESIPGFLSSLSQKQIFNVHAAILNNNELLERIGKMEVNSAIYVKRENKDPNMRSFCITRDINGEFRLFIEPKRKRWDNTKRILEWLGGAYKSRKIAIRTDVEIPELYASLVAIFRLDDVDNIKGMQQEISTQQKFAKLLGIPPLIRGADSIKLVGEKKTPVHRYIIYSPYRAADLNIFLHNHHKFLTPEIRAHIVQKILIIIKQLHGERTEHKDIKAENFLTNFDKNTNSFEIELIDFGLAQTFGEPDKVRGTPNAIPAWIFINQFCGSSFNSINDPRFKDSICYEMLSESSIDKRSKLLAQLGIKSNGKHDMWSLLVLFHKILYPETIRANDQLKECKTDELLKTFIGLTPEELPSIDQAIESFNNSKYYALATAYQPKKLTAQQANTNVHSIDFNDILNKKHTQSEMTSTIFRADIGVAENEHVKNLTTILNFPSIKQVQKVTAELKKRYKVTTKLYEKAIKSQSELDEPRMVVQYYACMLCLAYKKLDQLDGLKTRGFFSQVTSCIPSKTPKYFAKAEHFENIVTDILTKQNDDATFISTFENPYKR